MQHRKDHILLTIVWKIRSSLEAVVYLLDTPENKVHTQICFHQVSKVRKLRIRCSLHSDDLSPYNIRPRSGAPRPVAVLFYPVCIAFSTSSTHIHFLSSQTMHHIGSKYIKGNLPSTITQHPNTSLRSENNYTKTITELNNAI